MDKIISWIKRLFFILFILSGVNFWLKFAIKNFINEINNNNNIFNFLSIFVIILLFFSSIIISIKYSEKINVTYLFIGIFVLNILYVLYFGMDTNQISDFKMAFDGELKSINYTIFPSWLIYSIYLQILKFIFGNYEIFPILFNCILSTTIMILIYNIIKLICDNKLAIFSTILLGIWPSRLMWNIILSPDLLNQLFIILAVYFFIRSIYIQNNNIYLNLILSGSFLAIGGWFKNTGIIMLIAFLIYIVLNLLKTKKYIEILKKCVFILISFIVIQNLIWSALCIVNGKIVDKNPTPHYLYVGLSKENNGAWFEGCDLYGRTLLKNNFDYKDAKSIVYDELIEKIRTDKNLNFKFFENKINSAFGSESDFLFWINSTMGENNLINKNLIFNLLPICDFYYILILIGILISGIISLRLTDNLNFISSLYIYGFYLILIILEVQGRYKMILYPFMVICSGYGYLTLIKYLIGKKDI